MIREMIKIVQAVFSCNTSSLLQVPNFSKNVIFGDLENHKSHKKVTIVFNFSR